MFIRSFASFFLVLMLMPMGHALMILMEHTLPPDILHPAAFLMGFVGMCIAIGGIFARGDTRQTLFGLVGGLLFWTGWVEFLFAYYAWRYGVHCDLLGCGVVQTAATYTDGVITSQEFAVNGQVYESLSVPELKALRGSRPEYLIMPATFGLWMMVACVYTFCTRTGCLFFNWLQRAFRIRAAVDVRPLVRHSSMVTFMELNVMMWAMYLLLMFLYDPAFLGDSHPVTFAVAVACLVASVFVFRKQLRIKGWGGNIRMAIATVLLFWTFVEVVARNGFLNEIWVDPLHHIYEMLLIVVAFFGVLCYIILRELAIHQKLRTQ